MKSKKRTIGIACTVTALSLVLLAGGTYALFSDQVSISNHLQAGTLDISLKRTKLESTMLDNRTGYLVNSVNNDIVDFSSASSENIFGLTNGSSLISPGCKFTASMTISNNGSVAFGYWLDFKILSGETTSLAQQLKLTVKEGSNEESRFITDFTFGSESNSLAVVEKNLSDDFIVSVEFIDDSTTNDFVNNDAQNERISFDLYVNAVQVTTAN